MHNNDEINEAIQHIKLTKKDQQLLVAGATLMTVATTAMVTTTNAHADTVKDNHVKTEQVNKVNHNVNNGWHANSVAQIKQAIQKQGGNVYTIQYGDTLGAIAQAMNINMTTLQQINHIANANVIIAGNKIGFSADHQNVQVMNSQGKVIAQAPVHASVPTTTVTTPVATQQHVAPVVQQSVQHATTAPVVHATTVNQTQTVTKQVPTQQTVTKTVPVQQTVTKEVPVTTTVNKTQKVTKQVPTTTTDANGNQITTTKPVTTTETVPTQQTVMKPVTTTETVNKPVTTTETVNKPVTTTTTTQTPNTNSSSSVASSTTPSATNSSSTVNSTTPTTNTTNNGNKQLTNGYTPQQPSASSSSANSSLATNSNVNSSNSQASQSSLSSSSMSNGYQPQDNQNSNSTEPQMSEYVTSGNGFDYQGFINYFNADSDWQAQNNSHISKETNSFTPDINIVRDGALRAINQIRANAGVAPVQYNDYLNSLAQSHAENSAEHSNQEITHVFIPIPMINGLSDIIFLLYLYICFKYRKSVKLRRSCIPGDNGEMVGYYYPSQNAVRLDYGFLLLKIQKQMNIWMTMLLTVCLLKLRVV